MSTIPPPPALQTKKKENKNKTECWEECMKESLNKDTGKYYNGWWSQSGKKEPAENGNTPTTYYKAIALNLRKKGQFFFRDDTYSARGTFYNGEWRPCKHTQNVLHLHATQTNNLRTAGFCNIQIQAVNCDNGNMEVDLNETHYIIPPVKKSAAKSARK